ncbi:hypothetical protein Taro_019758 [Colocasia esculenta]|uniref:Late embryogenesis abundant protein LEA-2 subgroup domain-containing protein n=1 Tax=Colocasia esculenta TaxID=4460 RepID=A0A843UXP1_COLES|nr:hypothetical protein [Colocasia esculenta]
MCSFPALLLPRIFHPPPPASVTQPAFPGRAAAGAMTEKLCPYHQHHHHHHWHKLKLFQLFLAGLLFLLVLVLIAIFVTWLVLRPTKPRFYLQDATVYSFNITGTPPNLLNSNIQVTITSRNPNHRIGIYYDRLDVYASYKYQPITPAAPVAPIYQGHHDVVLWSPFLCGVEVPLAPYLAAALEQDHAAGALLLYVKMDGRVRWKVGSWTSGHYHLFVNCPAVLLFGGGWGGAADATDGGGYAPIVRFQRRMVPCSVSA